MEGTQGDFWDAGVQHLDMGGGYTRVPFDKSFLGTHV